MKLQESKAVNMSGFIYIALQLSCGAASLLNLLDYRRILLKEQMLWKGLKYVYKFKQTQIKSRALELSLCIRVNEALIS